MESYGGIIMAVVPGVQVGHGAAYPELHKFVGGAIDVRLFGRPVPSLVRYLT